MDITTKHTVNLLQERQPSPAGIVIPAAGYVLPERSAYFFCKRCFDLVFSLLIVTVVLSWLIPLLGVLIRIDSGGPVFFLQKRVGWRGRVFTCYKLRTMFLNGEADEQPASEYDRRITRLGRFLRRTNLDELPQFLNVLNGTMSIVGPRPHMLMDCKYFGSIVPGYTFREAVKPGITGLAQIKGCHGPIKEVGSIFMRYQWDALYVYNAGFFLDCRIIRRSAGDFFLSAAQYIFTRKYADKNTQPFVGARAPGDKSLYQ